jgi:citronellyl-CoA dehydrogenase
MGSSQTIKSKEEIHFTKDHELVRRSVADFIKREINPYIDEWEAAKFSPLKELFPKMGKLGFLGIRYDPKYGGQGLDYWYETAFLEELGHIKGQGLSIAISVQTNMSTPAIDEFGSDYLKDRYLKGAISGEMIGAIAVTEPAAGSDVAALQSTAKKEGDYYILNGSKMFITNGIQADFFTLLARTSDEPGYHAFSLFVVPSDLPGVTIGRKLEKIGAWSSDTAELFFDNVKIPAENLIGNEGEGFIYQMKQFQHERFSLLPPMYIAARDMIKLTVDYLKERVVFGKPLIKKQALQHQLVDWLTEVECIQQLTYQIVRLKMAGLDPTKEISMAKLKAGHMYTRLSADCLRMHGGMGYMDEMLISRFYRDSIGLSFGGGADEVMRDIIAKLEGF